MPRTIVIEIKKSGTGKAELTTQQNELYEFIRDKSNWRSLPPSFEQMKEFLHFKSAGGVAAVLGQIKKKGWELPGKRGKI